MEKLKINPNRFKNRKSPNHTANWQLLGQEVSEWFGKPLYWLFHRYEEARIMDCYKFCRQKGIAKYQVLLALLNKK